LRRRDPHRDGRNRLVTRPEYLEREQRIAVLRGVAGRLDADPDVGVTWFAECLLTWLRRGGDFAATLEIQPVRGSRRTVAAIIRQEQVDEMLRKLSVAVGSDVRASAILRGQRPCPSRVRDLVADLLALRAPSSPRAFSRARKWTRGR
jgi:hypothetical protein